MKNKKTHFWDIFFFLTYPLGIGVFLLTNRQGDVLGGSALGGKIEYGKFLLQVDSSHFKAVSGLVWVTDLAITLVAICLGLLMIVGMGFFFFKYLLPYVRRSVKGPGDKL